MSNLTTPAMVTDEQIEAVLTTAPMEARAILAALLAERKAVPAPVAVPTDHEVQALLDALVPDNESVKADPDGVYAAFIGQRMARDMIVTLRSALQQKQSPAVPVYAIADRKPPIAPDSIRSHEVIALTINSSGEIGECCEAVWNYAFGYWECPDDDTGWTHWMEKPVVSVVPTPEGGENDGE